MGVGGIAAQGGIIIKTADVTERGHKVTDVVFDKTGTLTEGNLDVVHEEVFAHGDLAPGTDVYSIALALVKDNKHPVSQAVASVLSKRPCHPVNLQDVVSVPGCGIDAAYNNLSLRAGNPRWLEIDPACECAECDPGTRPPQNCGAHTLGRHHP